MKKVMSTFLVALASSLTIMAADSPKALGFRAEIQVGQCWVQELTQTI